jgi:mannose-6-phosphate isomerase class I
MEIIGVTDGALRIETGGDTLPLSAGQFCLIPAQCPASAARATSPVSFLQIYAG